MELEESINDLEDTLKSKIIKSADDVKLMNSVDSECESNMIEHDLIELSKWSQDWQMLFNVEKCNVMVMGA